MSWTGDIPAELLGGIYVRNGGNPTTNAELGRDAHWFDGDGMLTGVWFDREPANPQRAVPHFVNQYILTDVYLSSVENDSLRTPILPSIATLVNPLSRLLVIIWRIVRTVLIVLMSHLPGSRTAIKRISVANTSILYHDGRALATCESGPPIRITLPGLETVGWFNGNNAEGEPRPEEEQSASLGSKAATLGGTGPLSWMREWTTGHPKVDPDSGELLLFNCSFAPPYVHYSLLPTSDRSTGPVPCQRRIMNAPVPGCSGGKLMHDFGVSKLHSVILDLPLSLSPLNLLKNNPVITYEPEKPARFGVFPRYEPAAVRWFETEGCCIFHTANTWDEYDPDERVAAVNLLACRLTSASLVFSAGNIPPPPHPYGADVSKPKPLSFFARYDDHFDPENPEKPAVDETSRLLPGDSRVLSNTSVPISYDDQEQCRLYYYRFSMDLTTLNEISHQFALAAIPFEFPTVSPSTEMTFAQYIYGCSTTNESFGAALGKATKIDLIVKMDVKCLLARAHEKVTDRITGCVDERTVEQILASNNESDPIKVFKLPPNHFAQETRFIPRDIGDSEDNGYLLFYVFG